MNKIFLVMAMVGLCVVVTYGAPQRNQGMDRGAVQRREQDKIKRKVAHDLTEEGVTGHLAWKEYTANPTAKGEATLLVVLGGRDSFKGTDTPTTMPLAVEKALAYAKTQVKDGKTIIWVPELVAGRRPAPETPSSDGIAKAVRERAQKHGVKPERIFVTGYSMGGRLAYTLLQEDQDLFKRAVIVGAAGNAEQAAKIKADILACQGSDDDTVSLAKVKAMMSAIEKKRPGGMVLTMLNKTDHKRSEEAAYSKHDTWKWLFR
ncbi:MAG: prolyl oligopeptidase family serine peptidase [Kiritimatiellae bacterium]|nr:prolyl oligopeptidase family serine peptidase [Kiritimatiellia bacterium]